jgi:hypothetical protein
MPYYKLPLHQRETFMDGAQIFGKEKLMCVDGIGFYVRYLEGQEKLLTPHEMRRHLMCGKDTHTIIKAHNITEALDIFYRDFKRAGDDRKPTHKSLYIDTHYKFIEVFYCPEIRMRDKEGKPFTIKCGGLANDYCGCILDGYDAESDYCPIARYYDKYYKLQELNKLPVRHIRGFRYIRMEDVLTPKEMKPY